MNYHPYLKFKFTITHKRLLTAIRVIGLIVMAISLRYLFVALQIAYFNPTPESTKILDRNGALLYEIQYPEKGYSNYKELDEINPLFIDIFVNVEDKNFFHNIGIDLPRVARCLSYFFDSEESICGASTITQQYIKIILEHEDRNIGNKIDEILLAPIITILIPKDQLLERYLNIIYFSNLRYGVESASQAYFGKTNTDLDLAETTYLASIPNSPTFLDPYKNHLDVKDRQKVILDLLVRREVISKEQADAAYSEQINLVNNSGNIKAPHFIMMLNTEEEGTKEITTTMDLNLYRQSMEAITRTLESDPVFEKTNVAVVIQDADTGEILTLIGSRDYFDFENDGQVNVATSLRNPGSTLKPFTYSLSFTKDFTAATLISDKSQIFFDSDGAVYFPQNYDLGEHGYVTVREALANSYNIPAVVTLESVGVENLHTLGDQIGLEELRSQNTDLSATLGGCSISLLDLVNAYRIFPNGGRYLGSPILKEGDTTHQEPIPLFGDESEGVAYIISDILSDNDARRESFGSLSALNLPFRAQAKTGTSMDFRDSWTIGYTRNFVVGVWVGNNDNSPMDGINGIKGAGEIWHDVMILTEDYYQSNFPEKENYFPKPSSIEMLSICSENGEVFSDTCTGYSYTELFLKNKTPDIPYIQKKVDIVEKDAIAILEPWNNDTYILGEKKISLPITFHSNSIYDSYVLTVDKKDVAQTDSIGEIRWEMEKGIHEIQVDGIENGRRISGKGIELTVE